MVEDFLRIGLRDGLVWLPIILGFGLLHSRIRHIDVGLDGVVVLSGIVAGLTWNETGSYTTSVIAAVLAGAALSTLSALLYGVLGLPQLMVGIVFSLAAHAVSVNWVGESLRLRGTDLITGFQTPWWLVAVSLTLMILTHTFYKSGPGILARKLGDGVTVNTVVSPRWLLALAYALSGALYGLGAAVYSHKLGTARSGGAFEFLVVATCSYLCVSRLTRLVRSGVAAWERRTAIAQSTGQTVHRIAGLASAPEANALVGGLLFGTLVPVVLAYSPSPTSWKLVLAGCLVLALADYGQIARSLTRPRGRPATGPADLLAVKQLSFAYRDGPVFREVFRNAAACFSRGVTLIQGANGTGKSTLLHLLAGQVGPHEGELVLDGVRIDGIPSHRRPVYLVTQNPFRTVGSSLTVMESLMSAAGRGLRWRPPAVRDAVIRQIEAAGFTSRHFASAGLNPYSDTFWSQISGDLSGGQAAVVGALCAAASGKAVVAFDEPTTGLDDYHVGLLTSILAVLGRDHIVVVSTHDERLVGLADAVIRAGDLRLTDIGAEVRNSRDSCFGAQMPPIRRG